MKHKALCVMMICVPLHAMDLKQKSNHITVRPYKDIAHAVKTGNIRSIRSISPEWFAQWYAKKVDVTVGAGLRNTLFFNDFFVCDSSQRTHLKGCSLLDLALISKQSQVVPYLFSVPISLQTHVCAVCSSSLVALQSLEQTTPLATFTLDDVRKRQYLDLSIQHGDSALQAYALQQIKASVPQEQQTEWDACYATLKHAHDRCTTQ